MTSSFRTILFLIATLTAASASAADNFLFYNNARYGYEIAYPADFVAQGVSGSGDGQVFASATDDAELRVYASTCTAGEDVNAARQISKYIQEAKQEKSVVTYQRRGKDFAVVSGTLGKRIFYYKLIIRGQWCTQFRFEYEAAQKVKYDAYTARIASSFDVPAQQ
jgi:hypothetical protein